MTSETPHTDIRSTHILYRVLPRAWAPYLSLMRLDRPIGTWLLLLPAWWSISLATGGFQRFSFYTLYLFLLFGAGAVIMRGAGCVINDLWDRDLDKQVERTQSRPLAAGTITTRHALFFLFCLLMIGLLILLQLSPLAIGLGVLSLIPVILYPLAKRITWYPQAVLGLTFNFGALMGFAAVTGTLTLPPLLLYMAGFFWTMGYDTVYAHQDIVDDGIVGIKSTARKFGEHSPHYIAFFYGVFSLLLFLIGLILAVSISFYLCWAVATFYLIYLHSSWDINNPADSLRVFRRHRDYGLLVLLAFLML